MSELIVCTCCKGTKESLNLGSMMGTCYLCKGKGMIERKEPVIEQSVHDEVKAEVIEVKEVAKVIEAVKEVKEPVKRKVVYRKKA